MLLAQLGLLEWLKFVQASQEFLFRLVCVIKCLMILMESCYYYLLSISFGYVFVSTCSAESYTGKQVWGRHTTTTRHNLIAKIMKFGKVTSHEPHTTKQASSRPQSGPPDLLYGLPSPSLHCLTSRFVHGPVCDPYTLFSYVLLSVSNQIENHLIKQLKT